MLHALCRMLACLILVAPRASAELIFKDGFDDPGLVINEIVDYGADVVEFFNASGVTVDLSGWYFTNDEPGAFYTFPAGTTLAPGAYLVVAQPSFSFDLGSIGSVSLYSPNSLLFAGYSWQLGAPSTGSHSRCPNGAGPFTRVGASSLGGPNACPPALVINEVVDNAANGGPDAIEFFNRGTEYMNITGWYFTDSNELHRFTFPEIIIVPGEYVLLTNEVSPFGFTFGLGSADSVKLYTNQSELYDSYTWSVSAPAPSSHSRCPNGSGAFTIAPEATLYSANACPN